MSDQLAVLPSSAAAESPSQPTHGLEERGKGTAERENSPR